MVLRAQTHERRGNLAKAAEDLGLALDTVELLRYRSGGGEATRAGYCTRFGEYFDQMVLLQVRMGRPDLALEFAEKARARGSRDAPAPPGKPDLASLTPSLPDRARQLLINLRKEE